MRLLSNSATEVKARLMPGKPAVEGIVEGRGGEIKVDPKKIEELDQKKKSIEEVRTELPSRGHGRATRRLSSIVLVRRINKFIVGPVRAG